MGNIYLMLHIRQFIMFGVAMLIGMLFKCMAVPIPFLLGGIVSAMLFKVAGADVYWPRQWRELGLCVAGYGIGRNFTADTLHELSMQSVGVFEATFVSVCTSVIIAWWTSRHSYVNLQSCVMGCLPGGMTQMLLMSESDPRVDFNAVMVMQTLRLMGAIIIVPFLVVHGLGAEIKDTAVLPEVAVGHSWLWLVPIAAIGAFVLEKLHIPTAAFARPAFGCIGLLILFREFSAGS